MTNTQVVACVVAAIAAMITIAVSGTSIDGSPIHCKQMCEPRLVDKFEFNGQHVVCKCAEKGTQP